MSPVLTLRLRLAMPGTARSPLVQEVVDDSLPVAIVEVRLVVMVGTSGAPFMSQRRNFVMRSCSSRQACSLGAECSCAAPLLRRLGVSGHHHQASSPRYAYPVTEEASRECRSSRASSILWSMSCSCSREASRSWPFIAITVSSRERVRAMSCSRGTTQPPSVCGSGSAQHTKDKNRKLSEIVVH